MVAGFESLLDEDESPLLLAAPSVEAAAPELLSLAAESDDFDSDDFDSVVSAADLFEAVLFL